MGSHIGTNEVRLSYAHLTVATLNKNATNPRPQYGVTLLIPKSDVETVNKIKAACDAEYQAACEEKGAFKGFAPQIDRYALLHDGDAPKRNGTPYGPEARGCYVVYANAPAETASGQARPRPWIIRADDPSATPLTDEQAEFIKSGDYAQVGLDIFAYSQSGGQGITCALLGTRWTREGEPLGVAPVAPADIFADIQSPAAGLFQQAPAHPAPQAPVQQAPAQPAPQAPVQQAPAQPAPQAPVQQAPAQPAPQAPVQQAPAQPAPQAPVQQAPAQPAPQAPAGLSAGQFTPEQIAALQAAGVKF